ncbi:MAG: protein kinase [Gemmataceae bacterium]
MPLSCPNCLRTLADTGDPPAFCMYCGQRLRASSGPAPAAVSPDPTETVDSATRAFDGTPSDAPPAEPQRTTVGPYRLVRFLGAGGMGQVYEAEGLDSGQRVAVKLLSGRLAENPASVERFRQEGRVASQISHPHCVFVLGADADAGRPYIVMELMPGKTLKELVEDNGPLPPRDAVLRTLDVLAGLAEAHRAGVIHRDVKPSNCFLTADDRVKVGDFGLSKSLEPMAGDQQQLTRSGDFLGTVLFAAPEQIRGEPVGYESDVYSVAATLFFLLTGRAPHQEVSVTASLAKAVSEEAPPARRFNPAVPKDLDRVIARGLDRDRDRRFATLDEFADALRQLLPELQRPARPRVLVLAYLIDTFLLQLLIAPAEYVRHALTPRDPGEGFSYNLAELTWPAIAVTVVYFTLFEGLAGTTPGKRLLRLRVCRVGQTPPPGLGPALVRTVVFNAIWWAMFEVPERAVGGLGVSGTPLAAGGFVLGLAAVLRQLWRSRDGWRGLHDFAAGTRVVQRPHTPDRTRLVSRFPDPLDRLVPAAAPRPAEVGGFAVRGKLADLPDGGEVWAAADTGLGRRVLVRVFPAGADEPPVDDTPPRSARLRAIGHGTGEWAGQERPWVAYAAPAGAPLVDVASVARPLGWADARPILEQLADELAAEEEAGDSASAAAAVEQVWVEPGGRVQVVPFPLPTGSGRAPVHRAAKPATAPDPLRLVREVATLALEGVPRATGGRVAAPVPPHATRITDRLFAADGYARLADVRADLADSHAHPPRVTAGLRAGHLTGQAVLLALGLLVMAAVGGLFSLGVAMQTVGEGKQAAELAALLRTPDGPARVAADARKLLAADPYGSAARVGNFRAAAGRAEKAVAPDQLPHTLATLDALAAREAREEDALRRTLNRPERSALARFEQFVGRRSAVERGLAPVVLAATLRRVAEPGDPTDPGRQEMFRQFLIGLLVWPLTWAAFALVLRGGVAWSLAGLTLVRADGRRAGRLRWAVRELLVWLPFTLTMLAGLWLQATVPTWVFARTAVWLVGLLLLPVYVWLALREPARPPQDRVMGTYLVPV